MATYTINVKDVDYLITKDYKIEPDVIANAFNSKVKIETAFIEKYNALIIRSSKSELYIRYGKDLDIVKVSEFTNSFMETCKDVCSALNNPAINLEVKSREIDIYANYNTDKFGGYEND
jgi:hypothetical protein